MEWFIVVLLGLLAGTHTATWGMYKDAIHEGFTYRRYSRSILVSTAIAPVIYWFSGLDALNPGHLVVLFGLVYVIERGLTEFYKTYYRTEDQSKYFIPMQFHVFGKVVESRDPVGVILDEAQKNYDLLVLGATEEQTRRDDSVFHPIVDRIVRLAPCPTLVIRGTNGAVQEGPQRIVVPTNGSTASREAAMLAFRLARPDDVVVVLNVVRAEEPGDLRRRECQRPRLGGPG